MPDSLSSGRLGRLLRPLFRRPGFALVVVATLGLGLGANTAIFSLAHGVLLRPLPYPEPDQLVTVWENHEKKGGPVDEWTGASTFRDWRDHNQSFAHLAAYTGWQANLVSPDAASAGGAEILNGLAVSPEWFQVLGTAPLFGRLLVDDDAVSGAETVVILGHGLWQRRFGGDPGVVGRSIELNDQPATVVGILPASHEPLFQGVEIWRAYPFRDREDRGAYFLQVVGRLHDGVDLEAARQDMQRVASGVTERAPAHYRDVGVTLIPLHDRLVGSARPAILALAGAVALLLLVACANVANLLLVDAVRRRQEMAVRASLGAGRGRLVTQLVSESTVLAVAGGVLGLALGAWWIRLLVRMAPPGTPRLDQVALDPAAVLFALGLAVLTGFVFGLLPAMAGSRFDLARVLRPGGRSESRGQGTLRAGLVVAETALALCLLAGAGLLLQSFWSLSQVDLGFQPDGVVASQLNLPRARYDDGAERAVVVDRLVRGLADRPEVASAAAVSILPLSPFGSDASYHVEGTPPVPEGERPSAWYRIVTPGYFDTLGIERLQGRDFTAGDHEEAPTVVAVSERFARRWFGDASPLGRRMKFGGLEADNEWMTIVALVRDVRDRSAMLPHRDDIYLAHGQFPTGRMAVLARAADVDTADAETPVIPALRAELAAIDPKLPLAEPILLGQRARDSLWLPRLASQVLAAFAIASLALAALGLYGVLAHAVHQRRREFGVRSALGAGRAGLLRLVLGQGLGLCGLGLGFGLAGTWVLGASLRSHLGDLLHGVEVGDPVVLSVTAALLLLVATLASALPALRAARTDPAVCLREE